MTLAKIWSFARPYRRIVLIGTAAAFLGAAFTNVSPNVIGCAVDEISTVAGMSPEEMRNNPDRRPNQFCVLGQSLVPTWISGTEHDEAYNAILVFIFFALSAVAILGFLTFYKRKWLIGVSRAVEYDVRRNLFHHVLRMDASFFGQHRTGDLMSRFSSDIGNIRGMYGPGYMYILDTVLILTVAMYFMFSISWELTLVVLAPLVLMSYLVLVLSRKIYSASSQVQEQLGKMTSFAEETYRGIRVIKGFRREKSRADQLKAINDEYVKRNMRYVRIAANFRPLFVMMNGITIILLILVGGSQVLDGERTLGELTTFLLYVEMVQGPLIALGWVISLVQRGLVGFERVNAVMDAQPSLVDGQEVKPPRIQKGLTLQDVGFRYPGATRPAIEGVDVSVRPQETLGILGVTGSGKSTLMDLVLRFYDPTQGVVKLDDRSIQDYSLKAYRSLIGYVPQESFMFSMSIRDNLMFAAHPDTSDQDIERALEISRFNNDLEQFSTGLEQIIGERGATLSGGQRQRLAIARALLARPQILLLDDSMSAVDTHTEDQILEGLRAEMGQRVTLLVSQRISTLRSADRVLVLENGEVNDLGTPDELAVRCDLYRRIAERQRLEAEVAAY